MGAFSRSHTGYYWIPQKSMGIGSTDVKKSIKTLNGNVVGINPFTESELSKLIEVPNLGVESLIIDR